MPIRELVDRYFYRPLKEEQEEAASITASVAKAAAFLRTDYYPELKGHLEKLRRANEPKPGQEGAMLYQCGVRDGIDMVLNHLNDLTEVVRESHE